MPHPDQRQSDEVWRFSLHDIAIGFVLVAISLWVWTQQRSGWPGALGFAAHLALRYVPVATAIGFLCGRRIQGFVFGSALTGVLLATELLVYVAQSWRL